MADTEFQKVDTIMFRISQEHDDVGMELMWRDGSIYLSISKVMITDGERWYAIPFEELRGIDALDDDSINLRIEGVDIRVRGENAERLMALRHLLLPLIDNVPKDGELLRDIIKLLLLGIKDREIIASLLKRSAEEIAKIMESAEGDAYITDGEVSEKGKSLLSKEEKEMIEKAGVRI